MKTKLQMTKFIEKIRFNILTEGKGYKWKDNIKKNQWEWSLILLSFLFFLEKHRPKSN